MEHEWWCAEGDDCACDEDGPCIGVCAGCPPDCPLLTLPPCGVTGSELRDGAARK
ncbi:MAG TPA: hypothetical protein VIQ30_26750 [Pseudonocardia sp.]